MGVRGISLEAGDVVCAFDVVDLSATFLIACANGYGKRTPFDDFRKTHRGGKGIIGIQTSERNGAVVAAHTVRDNESLVMVTSNGMMVRSPVDQIRICGRNTQGVRLINLEDVDKLVSASVAPAEDADVPLPAAAASEEAPAPNEAPEPDGADEAPSV
jgi:DNA gyrase subunit A